MKKLPPGPARAAMCAEMERQVIALCDGTRTLHEIAHEIGCNVRTVQKTRARLRPMHLPVRYLPIGRHHEPKVPMGGGPHCLRCGLRGEHECVPTVTHFISSGTTNLGAVGRHWRQ